MIKLIGGVLLITAALIVFNREKVENYKQRVIEAVNPAAKEERLLSKLENEINNLEKVSVADKQKFSAAIGNAKSTLQELKTANQKMDLGANLSNTLQKISPLTSKPSPTWLPPGQVCKP